MKRLRLRDRPESRSGTFGICRRVACAAFAAAVILGTTLPAIAGTGAKPDTYAAEIVRLAHWPATESTLFDKPGGPPCVLAFEREELVPGIAHYWFDLRIGDSPYDVLRVHRVTKERRAGVPVRAADSIFLLHGDLFGFLKFIFSSATSHLPADASIAVRLAEAGWDVWGIDQPWVHVPAEETDFSFARDWGMQFQVDCVDRGVSVARLVRLFTGNGWRRMKLLGYSSGGMTTYAFMNQETQRIPAFRNVDGFVIADVMYKYDTSDPVLEAARRSDCAFGAYYRSLVEGGDYMSDLTALSLMGELASAAPDDPSPLFEGLTNLQVALVVGGMPDSSLDWIPWYHFVAPLFEEGGEIPVGLRFTQIGTWLDFMRNFVSYEPNAFFRDYYEIGCDEADVPWDDHLGDITVPMLLLSPNGGVGRAGHHTVGLLGSTDKTIVDFSFHPPAVLDYGHIDLWLADISPTMVWPTLLQWLDGHAVGHDTIAALQEAPDREPLRVGPNPGRAPYNFSFDLPDAGEAALEIFDVAGRRVASVLSGPVAAGTHQVVWDGRTTGGKSIADGVYFARVRTPQGTHTQRFVSLAR